MKCGIEKIMDRCVQAAKVLGLPWEKVRQYSFKDTLQPLWEFQGGFPFILAYEYLWLSYATVKEGTWLKDSHWGYSELYKLKKFN